MSDVDYLSAMHQALPTASEELDTGDDVSLLLKVYDDYLKVARRLVPPPSLAHAHGEIVAAGEAMERLLSELDGNLAQANFDELKAISERGAAGFAILRAEAQRLGLDLSFR